MLDIEGNLGTLVGQLEMVERKILWPIVLVARLFSAVARRLIKRRLPYPNAGINESELLLASRCPVVDERVALAEPERHVRHIDSKPGIAVLRSERPLVIGLCKRRIHDVLWQELCAALHSCWANSATVTARTLYILIHRS